ncbi:putative ATP-binding cassette protein subfamily C, member 1 [Trypanosoma cruzi]|uniref:Putative ATP-binding cassette protein subfamily C, member 1 n=1 Tax=Trypanosoma cruzi TaxID=5693 RepID=A0A2V2V0M8_TRYCR|nr:putative ATP-binding cassette protein subfamily C, member 1 [Trypanosoma cruzi]
MDLGVHPARKKRANAGGGFAASTPHRPCTRVRTEAFSGNAAQSKPPSRLERSCWHDSGKPPGSPQSGDAALGGRAAVPAVTTKSWRPSRGRGPRHIASLSAARSTRRSSAGFFTERRSLHRKRLITRHWRSPAALSLLQVMARTQQSRPPFRCRGGFPWCAIFLSLCRVLFFGSSPAKSLETFALSHFQSSCKNTSSTSRGESPSWSSGLILVMALFVVQAVQSAALHSYYYISINGGLRFRSALTAVIFEKCLVVAPKSFAIPEMSTGELLIW